MKKIIWLLFILTLVMANFNFVYSDEIDEKRVFIANEEQLAIMNSLINQNLSTGEVFSIVCPEFLETVKNKDILFKDPFDKDVNLDINYNSIGQFSYTPHGCKITNYGNSIKFWAYIGTQFIRPYMNMEVHLYSRDTGDLAAYTWAEDVNVSDIEAIGYADPPTGTYYAWSQAKWIVDDSGHWAVSNALSLDMYYHNPYQ